MGVAAFKFLGSRAFCRHAKIDREAFRVRGVPRMWAERARMREREVEKMDGGMVGDEILESLRRVPGKRWSLLLTRPRNEKWAARTLEASGIRVYLPLLTKVEIHNRSRRETRLPMFPGYLFACAGGAEENVIRTNKCVRHLQTLSETDEDSLIRDLRIVRLCELQSARHELVVNPGLRHGDAVRIKSGAFRGHEAIVVRRVDALSVIINLDFLGRSVDMHWEAGDLEL